METEGHIVKVDLRHALLAIARALDYVGIDDENHGHRVAYMAYKCAVKLGWSELRCEQAYFTGLIHDCGVSQSNEHLRLVQQLAPQEAQAHCVRGYDALTNCSVLDCFAIPILHHHTFWQELTELDMSAQDKEMSALIFLADRIDFFRASYLDGVHDELIVLKEELIADNIREYKGTLFHPDMVDAMVELILTDSFWFGMEPSNIEQIGLNFSNNDWFDKTLSLEALTELAQFLANIVDAKSPFTLQHSIKVAELSKLVAQKCGLDSNVQDMLYIAGLMHDLGKLKTPDDILHKRGQLTELEYLRIKRHTTDTEMTLMSLFPQSIITEWASNHHERLDGSGYPNHYTEEELDFPSRIIAVVDIFQALSQDRPYRGRMTIEEITELMNKLVDDNKIDGDVFGIIQANMDECYQLSITD